MDIYRHLTNIEINTLENQGCNASNWNNIYVSNNFDTQWIWDVTLSGNVRIGIMNSTHSMAGGVSFHSGIYNATIHNCIIGDNVLIKNISQYISNYKIGDNTQIINSHLIYTDKESYFGNGIEVSVLNETGGREVKIFNKLSSHLATILALYRYKPLLISNLNRLISNYCEDIKSDFGSIGDNVTIKNTNKIIGTNIGDYSQLDGCTKLINGTINSTKDAPTLVGDGVIAHDFIISSGSKVENNVLLKKCFIGQSCNISNNFTAHDSLFFSNTECENGESCAVFAGPHTITMHKSTLLIAGMFSFMNAGSGTNQSNHLYKLGAIHQGITERGCKASSDSYIMWPANIGAFSLIIGRHYSHPDTSDFPFSYVIEEGKMSYISPGANYRTSGTMRDSLKWEKRDSRKDKIKLDNINYSLTNPWIIGKIIKALAILKSLYKTTKLSDKHFIYKNAFLNNRTILRGIKIYQIAIDKYFGDIIIKHLKKEGFLDEDSTIKYNSQLLEIDNQFNSSFEWFDLSGFIIPKNKLFSINNKIEKGELNNIDEINQLFLNIFDDFESYEWNWCRKAISYWYGDYDTENKFGDFSYWTNNYKENITTTSIDKETLILILGKWKNASEELNTMIFKDATKEYSPLNHTGFGINGTPDDKLNDFIFVHGKFEENTFVAEIKKTNKNIKDTYNKIINKLDKYGTSRK